MQKGNAVWRVAVALAVLGTMVAPSGLGAPAAVKIAFLGPLTGPNSAQGQGARNAFDLAIRQANASRQFGFQIEGLMLDDASDPATGRAAALRAVSDPAVVAATGHWNSPVAFATIEVFHEHRTAIIIWGAVHPDLTRRGYAEVTRVAPTAEVETAAASRWAVRDLKFLRWAVVHDTTTIGVAMRDAFVGSSRGFGAEILSVDGINVGDRDFSALLTRIRSPNPSGIFFGGILTEGALIRSQMARLRIPAAFLSISGIIEDRFIEVAGAAAAEGTMGVRPGVPLERLAEGRKFAEEYQRAGYREPFGAFGPYAYDATNIILDALRRVGPDRVKLVEAIRGIKYRGLIGEITFGSDGQNRLQLSSKYIVQDGKWVLWEDSEYASGKRKLPGQ